jgi:hypothetical protein
MRKTPVRHPRTVPAGVVGENRSRSGVQWKKSRASPQRLSHASPIRYALRTGREAAYLNIACTGAGGRAGFK